MITPSSKAEYIKKSAQSGMPFLTIDVSGRTAAMGSAGSCIAADASAMFFNIAGLAQIQGLDVMVNQTSWIVDSKQYSGAVAYNLGRYGTIGASLVWMDYGDFAETVPYTGIDVDMRKKGYESLGNFSVNEYALGLSYARKISTAFSFGGQVKYAMQDLYHGKKFMIFDPKLGIETESSIKDQVIAFDFGTMYYTGWKDLRFGMSIRNFSRQGKFVDQRFELPLTMTMGVAMDVLSIFMPPENKQHLTLSIDALHPRNWTERLHVGAEYALYDMLYVRGGYKFNYSEESFCGGIGVAKSMGNYGLRLDYAYSDFGGYFGSVHRITLGLNWK
jgi:hypothetical protein